MHTEADRGRPDLTDRASAARKNALESRKRSLLLACRSNPAAVPKANLDAASKRLWSLLDENPGGKNAAKRKVQQDHQNKRPRKEEARALHPGTVTNPIAPRPSLHFGSNDETRPKDVLQVYSHANLLPTPGSLGLSRSWERRSTQTAPGPAEPTAEKASIAGRASQSAPPAAAAATKSVGTAPDTSSARPQNVALFASRCGSTSYLARAPAMVQVRNRAQQRTTVVMPESITLPKSRESSGRPPPRDTVGGESSSTGMGQLLARIGLVGLANRPTSTFSARLVDRHKTAPPSKRVARVDSSAPPRPTTTSAPNHRSNGSSRDDDDDGDREGRESSASETNADADRMSFGTEPSPATVYRPTASSTVLASALDIPKPSRGDQGAPLSGRKSKQRPDENFVRLNLKNSSGSCRGRPSRSNRIGRHRRGSEKASGRHESAEHSAASSETTHQDSFLDTTDLMDPVDGFLDGVYGKSTDLTSRSCEDLPYSEGFSGGNRPAPPAKHIPQCRTHNLPCRLCTVKKTSNKGRKFWVCSLPREEQCQHFQWEENSVQAAQQALLRNQTTSGFIARRVASYMQGLAPWTVPELRSWMDRRCIACPRTATKSQIKTKIAIWVRDQVARSVPQHERSQDEVQRDVSIAVPQVALEEDENEDEVGSDTEEGASTASSSSDEELILLDAPGPALQVKRCAVNEGEGGTSFVSSLILERGSILPCPLKATLQSLFGFSSFRHGQEWAIRRCLENERTLLVAPTGFGKSLCYAIPAAMKDGVCIVVSPLLSLIQDQLRMLPPQLPAATLSGSLSAATMASTLDDILRGRIKIVFVSPERLASPSFRRMFHGVWNADQAYRRRFPKVSLLCLDEAHCLSQWAHNFRPSYLRLCSAIQLIQPESILAITATAGPRVVEDISRVLFLNQDKSSQRDTSNGVLVLETDRDNIDVSTFILPSQEERLNALISLLLPQAKSQSKVSKSKVPQGCLSQGSVIVYVWRQRDAEIVAENIQASSVPGGVVVYHAGMKSCDREKAQNKFLRGKVRICVATVAFGLGIDKSDVRGVVHMSLASSTEHYLQEIGRAGRDGYPAKAIALILPDEVVIRHSLSHSDKISRSQTRRVFDYLRRSVKESLSIIPSDPPTRVSLTIGFPLSKTANGCDCKPETVETLISLFELPADGEPLGYVEGICYDCVTIAPKRRQLKDLADKEPLARAVLTCSVCVEAPAGESLLRQHFSCLDGSRVHAGSSFGAYKFSVALCASVLGPDAKPRHVFAALRRLERSGELELALDTSPSGKSLIIRLTQSGLSELSAVDERRTAKLSDEIHERLACTIDLAARKTLELSRIMLDVSTVSCADHEHRESSKKSASLVRFQGLVHDYFASNDGNADQAASDLTLSAIFSALPSVHEMPSIVSSVQSYLATVEAGMTDLDEFILRIGGSSSIDYIALAVTKFLHGIGSCRAPHSLLRTHPLFGRLQGVLFSDLEQSVKELLERQSCRAEAAIEDRRPFIDWPRF